MGRLVFEATGARFGRGVGLLFLLAISCVVARAAPMPPRVQADTACSFGAADCNRCVRGMLDAVKALHVAPTALVRYSSMGARRLPPYGAKLGAFADNDSHLQGIARLTGPHDSNWMVISRSMPGKLGGGGFFLVHLGDVPDHGGNPFGSAHKPARYLSLNPKARSTVYYHPVEQSDHAGGIQLIGHTLALAASCASAPACSGRAFIEFHDLSDPAARNTLVQRFELFRQGEPHAVPHATSVALAKERDGRYLMFVQGKDDTREGWFYRSDITRIAAETQWEFVDHFEGGPSWNGRYQSMSLLGDCGSSSLYLLGTGNPRYHGSLKARLSPAVFGDLLSLFVEGAVDEGLEVLHLFKLEPNGGHIGMRRVYTASWKPDRDGYCSFRAGASAYVTPEGRLALYCTTRKANTNLLGAPDSKLKLLEFAGD